MKAKLTSAGTTFYSCTASGANLRRPRRRALRDHRPVAPRERRCAGGTSGEGCAGEWRLLIAAGWVVLGWWGWAALRPSQLGGPVTYTIVSGSSMKPALAAGDLALLRPASDYQARYSRAWPQGQTDSSPKSPEARVGTASAAPLTGVGTSGLVGVGCEAILWWRDRSASRHFSPAYFAPGDGFGRTGPCGISAIGVIVPGRVVVPALPLNSEGNRGEPL